MRPNPLIVPRPSPISSRGLRLGSVLLLTTVEVGCGEATPAKAPEIDTSLTASKGLPSLEADEVLFSLRGKQAEARRCFERAGQPVRGSVQFAWSVAASGKVTAPTLRHSTLAHPEIERCLSDFVTGLHYERRETAARASWTFVHGLGGADVLERAQARRDALGKKRRPTSKERAALGQRSQGPKFEESSVGRLDGEAVESVAEHGFRLYAFCMRDGLHRDIHLSGRVLLRFSIDEQGSVRELEDAGSDLGDLEVLDCVAEGFYAMAFPAPTGGPVRLEYSILLNEE